MKSPYENADKTKWKEITETLVAGHPLASKEIVDVTLSAWDAIFKSLLGPKAFKIGIHIFPKPQILGFFLHELIPLELSARYPGIWRGEESGSDKDLVYVPNDNYSVEIKTSSDKAHIFGNRSYAQEGAAKKSKTGYYLAVNFEKAKKDSAQPKIKIIRFGWIDHADWQGQAAATGQQARLGSEIEDKKLKILYQG